MPRALLLVLLLLLPLLAHAGADLGIELSFVGTPFPERTSVVRATITNHGPDPATGIVLDWTADADDHAPLRSGDPRCTPAGTGLRCEIAALDPGRSIELEATHFTHVYGWIFATVSTATADPNPDDNKAILPWRALDPRGEVRAQVIVPAEFGPDTTLTIRYEITNQSSEVRAPLRARISIPSAIELVSTNSPCQRVTGPGVELECALDLAQATTFPLEVTARFAESAGRVDTTLEVIWTTYGDEVIYKATGSGVFARTFTVTTARDDGPGSLRATILDANERCPGDAPCIVEFAIDEPVPPSGWLTIKPLTPLPAVTGKRLTIDARTQPATNPLGPEVFLDGSALAAGNGLLFRESATVHGLAIGNFPDNGIYGMAGEQPLVYSLSGNYIGVDPTGTQTTPNLRGVMVSGNVSSLGLTGNVISGNVHSGVFAWQVHNLGASGNRIGVAAATEDPIPNGASGVFVHAADRQFSRVELHDNVIANNAHFGIAYSRDVFPRVGINRIYNNGIGGVDYLLDGPTPLNTPRIDRAYWDGSATVIEGMLPARTAPPISQSYSVMLYANAQLDPAGYAEGERFLGEATGDAGGRFTFRYEGDLRNLFVNGMTTVNTNYFGELTQLSTTEFGQAVQVSDAP
jgi:hypothetical protein